MSRPTAEDQYKFLLSCVRHSNNGKVDFVSVSQELGITSRGAAAKRYGRLLRLHGVKSNSEHSKEAEQAAANKRKSRGAIARAAEAKRRKIEGEHNDPLADDGDIGRRAKSEPGIKQERSSFSFSSSPWSMLPAGLPQTPSYRCSSRAAAYGMSKEAGTPYIKLEDDSDTSLKSPAEVASPAGYGADDERIFEDFCTSELFDSDQEVSSGRSSTLKTNGASTGPSVQQVYSSYGESFGTALPNAKACSRSPQTPTSSLQESSISRAKDVVDLVGGADIPSKEIHSQSSSQVVVVLD